MNDPQERAAHTESSFDSAKREIVLAIVDVAKLGYGKPREKLSTIQTDPLLKQGYDFFVSHFDRLTPLLDTLYSGDSEQRRSAYNTFRESIQDQITVREVSGHNYVDFIPNPGYLTVENGKWFLNIERWLLEEGDEQLIREIFHEYAAWWVMNQTHPDIKDPNFSLERLKQQVPENPAIRTYQNKFLDRVFRRIAAMHKG